MNRSGLSLIPILVAVIEERSLSKAAKRLNISQPAVSKAIKRLREVYGEPLLNRTVSGVEPTSFALDIYPALALAVKNFDSTLGSSRLFDPKSSKRVFSIACLSSANYRLIPSLMAKLEALGSNITLEVHPLFTEDLESDLRTQRYDIAVGLSPKDRSFLRNEMLYQEQLLVVSKRHHPRLTPGVMTTETFLAEQHVVASRWHSRQSLLNVIEQPLLAERKVAIRAAGVVEMLPIVAATELLALMPSSSFYQFAEHFELESYPFPVPLEPIELNMFWHPHRDEDSGHQWLRKLLTEVSNDLC